MAQGNIILMCNNYKGDVNQYTQTVYFINLNYAYAIQFYLINLFNNLLEINTCFWKFVHVIIIYCYYTNYKQILCNINFYLSFYLCKRQKINF